MQFQAMVGRKQMLHANSIGTRPFHKCSESFEVDDLLDVRVVETKFKSQEVPNSPQDFPSDSLKYRL